MNKPFKVGNIVVVINGDYSGNAPGTITKVTKVKGFPVKHIACKAETIAPGQPDSYNTSIDVKTPSWIESINDIRHATPEERKQYWASQQQKYADVDFEEVKE